MYPPLPRLADYDVSPLHGFLPANPPCERLSDPYYEPWESVIRNLHALVLTKRLRAAVDSLPTLNTSFLISEPEWRRAYSILGITTHAYIWSGGDTPADTIPPPLAIPFLLTCKHFELPPVAAYAGLALWNWKPLIPSEPIDNLENLFTLHTLTGSLDESWFFLVSTAIEARGAPIIPLMVDAMAAVRRSDIDVVASALRTFAETLDDLGVLLSRMYEGCDPHVFYHRIRPVLAGWRNMADAGLPNGVKFDTGVGGGEWVQVSGGSNAQSSIVQFFDIVLGIEHRPTGMKAASLVSSKSSEEEAEDERRTNFIHEMRQYMPGPHRRFLEHVSRVANIREFVVANSHNAGLRVAYDACLAMLRAFRDTHIQIVSRYIVIKSRERSTSPRSKELPPSQRLNLAVASSRRVVGDGGGISPHRLERRKLRGTGGTALIPFLKQARDETGEPAIDAWAKRLLNNGPGASLSPPTVPGARLTKIGEHASGSMEVLGLAGVWTVDDSEGGICHW